MEEQLRKLRDYLKQFIKKVGRVKSSIALLSESKDLATKSLDELLKIWEYLRDLF